MHETLMQLTETVWLVSTKGGWQPCRKIRGTLQPMRGYNKRGHRVWRTYKSVEEARENLRLTA